MNENIAFVEPILYTISNGQFDDRTEVSREFAAEPEVEAPEHYCCQHASVPRIIVAIKK